MSCYSCPYIKEEFEDRFELWLKDECFKSEEYFEYGSISDDCLMSCWCEKTGMKLSLGYTCGEEVLDLPHPNPKIEIRKLNRYERKQKYKRKLDNMVKNNLWWPSPAIWVDKYGHWTDKEEDKLYTKKYSTRRKISKYLKNQSDRKVRRYKGILKSGCSYRKLYDYWWELW